VTEILAFVLLALIGFCFFMLYRNERVYQVRLAFIDAPDYPHGYQALPVYASMLENPRYWLLWTEADWRSWVNRRRSVAA
jgi:hypothetical protein